MQTIVSLICRNKRLQYHDRWKLLFDPLVKSDLKAYYNTGKITSGEVDDYLIGCPLDYRYVYYARYQ